MRSHLMTGPLAAVSVIAIAGNAAQSNRCWGVQDPGTISISVTDMGVVFDMPDRVEAGHVTLELKNLGSVGHHAQILRLNAGLTGMHFLAAMETSGQGVISGHATAVAGTGVTSPGESCQADVRLEPGTYVVICTALSLNGVPRYSIGEVRELTVM